MVTADSFSPLSQLCFDGMTHFTARVLPGIHVIYFDIVEVCGVPLGSGSSAFEHVASCACVWLRSQSLCRRFSSAFICHNWLEVCQAAV